MPRQSAPLNASTTEFGEPRSIENLLRWIKAIGADRHCPPVARKRTAEAPGKATISTTFDGVTKESLAIPLCDAIVRDTLLNIGDLWLGIPEVRIC